MATTTLTTTPITLPALRADPQAIARIEAGINISDRAGLSTFGDNAQRSVTAFADKILSQTRNKDVGKAGELLTNIILKVKHLDAASVQNAGMLEKMFTTARGRIEKFQQQYNDVASQIDAISIDLDKHKDTLRRDIGVLDQLHEETKTAILNLDAHIAAGKQYAENFRANDLVKMKADADAGKDADGLMQAQAYQDASQALDRLEKRIYYLQQARQIGIQQLPQIRMVQAGDETLIENLQATSRLTIPAWKQKVIVLLGLNNQREALDMQRTVTDATNEMMKQASDMMKGQAVDIEKQSQRGIVDMETLQKTNSDLIDTVTTVMKVQEDGRAARAAAEKAMQQMTMELQKALTQSKALV
jgi:uncharacterized protein YaaN involved in tellurite resistance